jgi:bifunctional non-homologous end joining protein LigD
MRVSAFIEPCLPSRAERPPAGPGWVHEIKHDGFRMMVRRNAAGVRLLTRNGNNWTDRFPLIAAAAGALKVRSCLLDGEAVACDGDGMPSFDRLRYRRADGAVFLFAFDLLELDGRDLRREPFEVRKATLASVLRKAGHGLQLNEHLEHEDGRGRVPPRLQDGPRRHRLEAARLALPLRPLARLAQDEERRCSGREARSGGRMRQQETMVTGKNRIMIYGPKTDGRYVVKFRTAASRWRSRCRVERPACSSTSRERRAAPMAQMTNWSARRLLRDLAS